MATLTGEVVALNKLDSMIHAVGAAVVVRLDGEAVGNGLVAEDHTFSIELPDGLRGELEITLAMLNAAPTMAAFDDNDLHISIFHNNVNNFIA